jgi:3-methyladenine DNA glycosylase AlkD
LNCNNDIKLLFLKDLKKYKNKALAKYHAKYFQTQMGGYGEGDFFWGLRVPQQRVVALKYLEAMKLDDVEELLKNKVHEVRFAALVVLVERYRRASDWDKINIVRIYLRNSNYINNWDLVDSSAANILGHYWYNSSLSNLWEYAKSSNLWKERTAMVSTLYFIKQKRFIETFQLAKMFLVHKHDLIHKASGWMLREVGKKSMKSLISFLDKYSKMMPRTMLRYSIELLPLEQRKYYLQKDRIKNRVSYFSNT